MRNHKEKMKNNAIDFLFYSYFKKVTDKNDSDEKSIRHSETVDFLFYAYFGKVKDNLDSEKKIIEIAIEKAYQDATLEGAYTVFLPKPKDEDDLEAMNLKLRSAAAYDEACLLLKIKVKELLNAKDGKEFDRIHMETCIGCEDKKTLGLVDIYKKHNILKKDKMSPCFTPGNAQKWVNMTMKNLYVICGMLMVSGCNDSIGAFCERVLKRAQYFHIPIDSYILEAWKDIPFSDSSYIKINSNGVYVKYDDDFTLSNKEGALETAWSAMQDYKIYLELRDKCASVALDKCGAEDEWPIEWESVNWIKISEERKERKKQKDSATGES